MIVCCGENLIDMVPAGSSAEGPAASPYGSFRIAPGGSPYNSAIAAARLGAKVCYLGAMASDFLGDKLYSRLVDNGVGTDLLVRTEKPVTLAFVERNSRGEARYAFYAEGAADRSLTPQDLPERLPEGTNFILAGSISIVLEPAASTILGLIARESKRTLVSFDPNIRASLIADREGYLEKFEDLCRHAAILKASDSDLEWLYGRMEEDAVIRHILSLGPELVFITRGVEGSLAATRTAIARSAAIRVQVVDTIGAGDTFHAALLAALDTMRISTREALRGLGGETLEALLRFASAAAGINCAREGTDPPTLDELRASYPDCVFAL